VGLLLVVIAAASWASGSFLSPRLAQPADPLASTALQMLLGGAALTIAAAIGGEFGDLHPGEFNLGSAWSFTYLVTIGSLVAFSAYVWLLRHAPISKVATYAYVNPVVAVLLGWSILGEDITAVTLAGATVIVASVAAVVRTESAGGRATRRSRDLAPARQPSRV
jgi:drug/metabolite transporter (DMT)-like permease